MAIRMSGMVSGLDTDSIVKELMTAQKGKNQKVVNKQTKLTWTQDKWKELNTKLYSLYTQQVSKMRIQGNYKTKAVSSSDDTKAAVTAGATSSIGSHTLEVNQLASAQYVTGGKLSASGVTTSSTLSSLGGFTVGADVAAIKINSEGKDYSLTISDTTTIGNFVDKCKEAGLNASFDTTQKRLFISSETSGENQKFTIDTTGVAALGTSALGALGIGPVTGIQVDPVVNTDMTVVAAQDSKIILDGATLTSANNTITANGLTFEVKGKTTAMVSLNVSNDTKAVYGMVKEFVTKYNEVLKEMNGLYYAPASKGYEPLTDDEKEQMGEEETKKWETKIKDSLLRRDGTMGTLASAMRQSAMSTTLVNGKQYSLSSFGINTSSDYTEKGLLHIYGDKDDATYASKTNKLMESLEKDPELVMEALSGIAKKLYDSMGEKMSAIPNMRSALTFYNDKDMATQQASYKKRISIFEKKLTDMESRYYKQFTAMEKMLSKLQSESSSLASMLGGSSN